MNKTLLFLLLLFTSIAKAQTNLYVDSSVAASGLGTSWTTAYKTLNEAITLANRGSRSTNYVINIAKGTYYAPGVKSSTRRDSTFFIGRAGVKLLGGFPTGGSGVRSVAANPVILDADLATPGDTDNTYNLMVIAGISGTATDSIILDGLSLRNAWGERTGAGTWFHLNGQLVLKGNGPGLVNQADSATLLINNCSFIRNYGGAPEWGGAIFNTSNGLIVTNCLFLNNTATSSAGAAICNLGCSPVIRNSVFTGNSAWAGGAIYINRSFTSGPGPVIDNCTFTANAAQHHSSYRGVISCEGGAIFDKNIGSPPSSITNCTFSNNISTGYGGAIYCMHSAPDTASKRPYISKCSFLNNTAGYEGGGLFSNAILYPYQIDSSSFSGNKAGWKGGGISTNDSSTTGSIPQISNCTFTADSSLRGGALYYAGSQVDVYNCSFTNNIGGIGTGIYTNTTKGGTYRNNRFSGNRAAQFGGGIFCRNGGTGTTISNCLITGNMATTGGGGLCDSAASPYIINCTFAGDSALAGNGIYNMSYSSPAITNSIIWEGAGRSIVNASGTATVTYSTVQGGYPGISNYSANPAFASPVAAVSAPTTTGNYQLTSCSQSINSGNNSALFAGVSDLANNPRIADTTIDRGAYEFSGTFTGVYLSPVQGRNSVCINDTIRLSHSVSGGTWSVSDTSIAGISNSGILTAKASGTVAISYSVSNSTCTSFVTHAVTVHAAALLTAISGNSLVCVGTPVTLANATAGGSWSVIGSGIASVNTSGVITGISAGADTIVYTVVNTGGCISRALKPITVRTMPAAPASINRPVTICSGRASTFSIARDPDALSYTWSLPSAWTGTSLTDSIVALPDTSGGFINVSITTACGTSTATSMFVTSHLSQQPFVFATAIGGNTICSGSSVTFRPTAQVSGPSPAYTWYVNGAAADTGSQFSSSSLAHGDTVTVIMVSSATCAITPTATSQAIRMTVHAIPPAPVASANTTLCIGDTLFLSATSTTPAVLYSWKGPGFSSGLRTPMITNVGPTAAGTYSVSVTANGCVSKPDSVVVNVGCMDSVWAGDVNYDKQVNHLDALQIGLTMGSIGPARIGTSITWAPKMVRDWSGTMPGYPSVNRKHADCDGSGSVAFADTLAVSVNYGMTHPKGVRASNQKTAGLPDLYFDLSGINLIAGQTIHVPIVLGSAASPVRLAGIAARILIENITLADSPMLTYPASWLGGANPLQFAKGIGSNRLDWAYSRTDQQNTEGSGVLAMLTLAIPPGSEGQQLRLRFDDVVLVDSNGSRIPDVNILEDSLTVLTAAGVKGRAGEAPVFSVSPNPSREECKVRMELPNSGRFRIVVRDLAGKLVCQTSGEGRKGLQYVHVSTEGLTAGIYMISFHSSGNPAMIVRWIKQ